MDGFSGYFFRWAWRIRRMKRVFSWVDTYTLHCVRHTQSLRLDGGAAKSYSELLEYVVLYCKIELEALAM